MTVIKTCTTDKERQERKYNTITLLAPSHNLAEAKKTYRYCFGTISTLSVLPSFLPFFLLRSLLPTHRRCRVIVVPDHTQ